MTYRLQNEFKQLFKGCIQNAIGAKNLKKGFDVNIGRIGMSQSFITFWECVPPIVLNIPIDPSGAPTPNI